VSEVRGVSGEPLTAVVYARISDDRSGKAAGVARQQEDCLELAGRLGLTVTAVLVDNDVSAFDGVARPGYDALLRQVRAGVSRVVVWHLDRLYRRPRELEQLLELVTGQGVRIEAVRGGAFDLNTSEGRLMARQFVAIAAYESGHKADRVRRALRQRAEAGAWHGGARYGYGRGGELVPAEARMVREIVDRFLAGGTVRAITGWLNTTTPPPRGAAVWHAGSVRGLLGSERIAAIRTIRGTDGSVTRVPGTWPAIVSAEEYKRLHMLLEAGERSRVVPSVASLLSGLIRCGRCGAGLAITTHRNTNGARTRRYVCRKDPARPERGGLSIDADATDANVTARVLVRLATADTDSPMAGYGAAWSRLVMLIERRRHVAEMFTHGDLDARTYSLASESSDRALREAEAELLHVGHENLRLTEVPYGDRVAIALFWDRLRVQQRRSYLRFFIDQVTVAPGRPGRSIDPSRVGVAWAR
jgi:site-specific DNA recombinase